ncbi:MAG: helix-turn-helix transcriptional regulator [Mangrovibacterium sp.]
MKISEHIKKRRLLLGITQQDLADFSEVSLRTIREIELGKANPSLSTLTSIADVLGMELDLKIKTPRES